MSRQLMAASMRLNQNLRAGQLVNITRTFAGKKVTPPPPPKKPSASDCPGKQTEQKPKPGFFASGGTHAVFSDMPVPEGDFMKAWYAKNSKYNLVLLSGLAALIGSIALCVATDHVNLFMSTPDYPYTEEELDEFEKQEEERLMEIEESKQRHEDRVAQRELTIRRRQAKDAMAREVELMQKDIDEGISDKEMDELKQLAEKRAEFEKWENEEVKRIEEEAKQREKEKKELEKQKQQKEKEKEKEKAAKKKAVKN